MVDTGAGLSLGRLDYHKSIYETRPHVVSSFVYLKDSPDMDEFDIGGVDEFRNPTRVTAIITYKPPFHINGSTVTLSYGLSASASTNTILVIQNYNICGTKDQRELACVIQEQDPKSLSTTFYFIPTLSTLSFSISNKCSKC
jgi:hypothetical protein